jgi:hypothetical protein
VPPIVNAGSALKSAGCNHRHGTFLSALLLCAQRQTRRPIVGGLIYLIGLIVVILFILSFLGLR